MSRGRRTRAGARALAPTSAERVVGQAYARADWQIAQRVLEDLRGGLGLAGLGADGQGARQMVREVEAVLEEWGQDPMRLKEDCDRLADLADLASFLPATECLVLPLLSRLQKLQLAYADALEAAAGTPRSAAVRSMLDAVGLDRAPGHRVHARAQAQRADAHRLERSLADPQALIGARRKRCQDWVLDNEGLAEQEMLASLRSQLLGPTPEGAGALLAAYWERAGHPERAREAAEADPDNYRRAARIERAWLADERPETMDPFYDYQQMSEERLDELRAQRLAGDRGERALSRIRGRWRGIRAVGFAMDADKAGAIAARMLRCPEDYAFTGGGRTDGDQELVVPVSDIAFRELRERFSGRPGVSVIVRAVPDPSAAGLFGAEASLRLVGVDEAGRTIAVNLVNSPTPTRARTRSGLVTAARLGTVGVSEEEVAAVLEYAEPGPRAAYAKTHEAEAPEPGLLADLFGRERCDHAGGAWRQTDDKGAIRLTCPSCEREALACIPLYRLSPDQQDELGVEPVSEVDQLTQARRYAILDGAPLAEGTTLADLARRDGPVASLAPASYALDTRPPARPPRRAGSLGEVMAGRRGRR